MKPNSEIWLLDCKELSSDYSNTWDWGKSEEFHNPQLTQQKYFKSKVQKTCTDYSYIRKENSLKVHFNIDTLYKVNYVMYKNSNNKWYYCFVTEKEYINDNTTKLYITTDLIQTYMFDYILKESYVDRCHVNRWTNDGKPTQEIEPENIEFGEYRERKKETIANNRDSYLIITSNPLGVIDNRHVPSGGGSGGGGSDLPSTGGDWEQGELSEYGFRFVKGYEAFAPYEYKDDLGYPTICYGVTKHGEPDVFAQLKAKEPVEEEEGAKISYKLKKEKYGKVILPTLKELGITRQGQFDALLSFSYNLGTGVIMNKQSLIYKTLKASLTDEDAIRKAFVAYRNPGSIVEEGLKQRRNEECDIFFGRKPKPRKIAIWGKNNKPTGKYVTENNGNGWLPTAPAKVINIRKRVNE